MNLQLRTCLLVLVLPLYLALTIGCSSEPPGPVVVKSEAKPYRVAAKAAIDESELWKLYMDFRWRGVAMPYVQVDINGAEPDGLGAALLIVVTDARSGRELMRKKVRGGKSVDRVPAVCDEAIADLLASYAPTKVEFLKEVATRLLERNDDPQAIKDQLLWLIHISGPVARPTVPALHKLIATSNDEMWNRKVFDALLQVVPREDKNFLAAMKPVLSAEPEIIRRNAAIEVSHLGANGIDALTVLDDALALAKDKSERNEIVAALCRIGAPAASILYNTYEKAPDSDTLEFLAGLPSLREHALPIVLPFLKHPSKTVRVDALQVAASNGITHKLVQHHIETALKSRDTDLRKAALELCKGQVGAAMPFRRSIIYIAKNDKHKGMRELATVIAKELQPTRRRRTK